MQDKLYYSVYAFDENTCNYSMVFSSTSIFSIIDFYTYFIKKFPDKFVKVSRDIQIYEGGLC